MKLEKQQYLTYLSFEDKNVDFNSVSIGNLEYLVLLQKRIFNEFLITLNCLLLW